MIINERKNKLRYLLQILPGVLAIAITLPGCRPGKNKQIDQLVNSYDGAAVPGAAVMVIKNGKILAKKTYGLANLEEKIPVHSGTNFRLASVTRQFTAMGIMMLVERGKMAFDDSLRKFFPGFPDYASNITIRHLLQHTGGLIDYESLLADTATVQVLDNEVLNMMMAQDSTYFPPGTEYRYSNSAYAVLAMVIAKVSGLSFAQFLAENIFKPLEMSHTVAYEKGISEVKHRAYGYTLQDSTFVFTDQSPTSAVLGDGGIYSSIVDLFKWDQALYTDKLVALATLQQAFTPGQLANGAALDYGFGWRIDTYKGHRRVYHTGSTEGFRTIIQRYPDDQFTVIILTNRSDPELSELANRLTDIYLINTPRCGSSPQSK